MNAAVRNELESQLDRLNVAGFEARIPLTESQREIWLATQMQPEANLAFNEGTTVTYSGNLDVGALRKSLQQLVERHEILRASISPDGKWLGISEPAELSLPVTDIGGDSAALAAAEREAMAHPFDLERDHLIRFRLLRAGPTTYYLLITTHHILVDGWSWSVLLRELSVLYSGWVQARPAELPDAPHYGDYVDLESAFLQSEEGAAHVKYWQEQLDGAPLPAELPRDKPTPGQRTYASDGVVRTIGEQVVAQIRKRGAEHGASLVATTLAGFAALLNRVAGHDDMVIGLFAAGQSFYEQRGLVGHCVNMLPLRVKTDGAHSFSDLLRHTRQVVLDAFDHQGVTFGTLLPKLDIQRDEHRPPLVSIIFNVDIRDESIAHHGVDTSYRTMVRQAETFEWFINLVDDGRELTIECTYNRDLFSEALVLSLLDDFEALLVSACADPQQPLAKLNLLSAPARQQIVHDFNATKQAFPAGNIHEVIFARAAQWPDRVAVKAGGRQLTYAQLEARADALASALVARGAGPGRIVALCVQRGVDLPASLLGILKTGAAYLPLDLQFPPDRLAYMLEDSGAALILGEQETVAQLPASNTPVLLLEDVPAAGAPPHADVPVDSPAYVIYTSGSTGKPKGVVLRHGNFVNFIDSMARTPGMSAGDTLLAVTTISFDIAGLELYLPLYVGGCVVIADRETAADGERLLDILTRNGVGVMQATPATWRLLIGAGWRGGRQFRAFCGGEPLPADLAALLLDRVGELWNLYGPTETTVWSTAFRVRDARQPILIGKPIANTQCYVLDANLAPLPVGVRGELWIGGTGVAQGYHQRPELTAERFIADPFAPGNRIYKTGDLARWLPNGELECLGRIDFQVKLRGYRIELGEIEAQLAMHPAVAESVCMVRERVPGDAHLVAYVVARAGAKVVAADLRNSLRGNLPGYMIPQHVVELQSFPRLPNGKLNRKELPDPFAGAAAGTAAVAKSPPQTAMEKRIAALWQEALRCGEVDRDDRFLELGGHSLLAVQISAKLQAEYGVRLPLRAILMETLANLALQVGGEAPAPADRKASAVQEAPRQKQEVFYFGPPGRQLFGALTSPVQTPARDTAILFCHSWGMEYMRSYFALKTLADRLARAGFATLRFDYSGSGDSAGFSTDARVAGWLSDIQQAAAELKRRTGAANICLVGLRLGALLAAQASAAGMVDAAQLVLWDSPASGADWLRELQRLNCESHRKWNLIRAIGTKLPPPGKSELLGTPISKDFMSDLEVLEAATSQPAGVNVIQFVSQDAVPVMQDGGWRLVRAPDAAHWSRVSWLTTPWNPSSSMASLINELQTTLP